MNGHLAKYLAQSQVSSNLVLKGLSHEIDLAFDDMYG
jgi:hypothetical protein